MKLYIIFCIILIISCIIDISLNVNYGKYIIIAISSTYILYSIYNRFSKNNKIQTIGKNDKSFINVSTQDLAKNNLEYINKQIENFQGNKQSEEFKKLLISKKYYEKIINPSYWQKIKNKFVDSKVYGTFKDEGKIYGEF